MSAHAIMSFEQSEQEGEEGKMKEEEEVEVQHKALAHFI